MFWKRYSRILPLLYITFVLIFLAQDVVDQRFSLHLWWNSCTGNTLYSLCVTPAFTVIGLISLPGTVMWIWLSVFVYYLFPSAATANLANLFGPIVVCTAMIFFGLGKGIDLLKRRRRLKTAD